MNFSVKSKHSKHSKLSGISSAASKFSKISKSPSKLKSIIYNNDPLNLDINNNYNKNYLYKNENENGNGNENLSLNNNDINNRDSIQKYSNFNLPEKLVFVKGCNEWDEIVKYDQKLYNDEQINNKLKDKEIKKRIREDLDNQILHKIKREQEELIKQREYDEIMLNHCNALDDLEKQRQKEQKEMIMKEKENRDKLLIEEKNRKKMEKLKEKKYDREYVKNILLDLERDKQVQIKKRKDERELMFKTILENQLNKQRQMENKEKERLIDIRYAGEYGKVLDKQEQQRYDYFKRIERNGSNFIYKMAEKIKSEIDNRNKDEEIRMKMYLMEREKR